METIYISDCCEVRAAVLLSCPPLLSSFHHTASPTVFPPSRPDRLRRQGDKCGSLPRANFVDLGIIRTATCVLCGVLLRSSFGVGFAVAASFAHLRLVRVTGLCFGVNEHRLWLILIDTLFRARCRCTIADKQR